MMGGLVYLLQLHRCPDLSDFQQKVSSVLSYNEKLLKEKEALSEELNICVDKVVKIRLFTIIVQYVPQRAFVSLMHSVTWAYHVSLKVSWNSISAGIV